MENLLLVQFIGRNINDQYAMEVMYYCLKKSFIDRTLQDSHCRIHIGLKYFMVETNISFSNRYFSEKDGLLLLMSFRAIMLDKTKFDPMKKDGCYFLPVAGKYEWIEYGLAIPLLCKDEEFNLLYNLLLEACRSEVLQEEHYSQMRSILVHPGYKNLLYYCEVEAEKNIGKVTDDYISDRAFFCNKGVVDVIVEESILYVGNTAFAYCENLRSITFKRTDTAFGKFSIIECNQLKEIIVPGDAVNYYKEALPYYKDIIRGPIPKSIIKSSFAGAKINQVFDKRVTSYKYLWFWSFLTLAIENETNRISYESIAIRMVSLSWPLIQKYKLSFGNVDQMAKYIDQLYEQTGLLKKYEYDEVEEYLLNNLSNTVYKIISSLIKNVPYRFLSPWIAFESIEDTMKKSSLNRYNSPYSFSNKSIEIKEDWFVYFKSEQDGIKEFIIDAFIDYLAQFNTLAKVKKAFY